MSGTYGNFVLKTPGGGIDLSVNEGTTATGATTTSGLLDFYEEGSWTPTLWDHSNSDGEGQTYFTQAGSFTRLGRLVHLTGQFNIDSLGTLTGTNGARIGNLPYTAAGGTNINGGITIHFAQITGTYTAGDVITGSIENGNAHIRLRIWNSATGPNTDMLISAFAASTNLSFTGSYLAAP
jgi:hypothetical protein